MFSLRRPHACKRPRRPLNANVRPLRSPHIRPFYFALLLLLLVACTPTPPPVELVTLPSGKQVKVLGLYKIAFSKDVPALMLKYETAIPIENREKLTQEADEIWRSFYADVEKAHLTTGIISANEHPRGFFVASGRGFNFVYNRRPDGSWFRVGS